MLDIRFLAAGLGLFALGCPTTGVGDPCIPEDEYQTGFSGYSLEQVNVESRSFQCETRVCLVNRFQGRVSCPYGQGHLEGEEMPQLSTDPASNADSGPCCDPARDPETNLISCVGEGTAGQAACSPGGDLHGRTCRLPGASGDVLSDRIAVPVQPQVADRRADDAVYCSCRCDGPDPNATYCECPSGFKCEELVQDLGLPGSGLAGSYCVKNGTSFDDSTLSRAACKADQANCGNDGLNP